MAELPLPLILTLKLDQKTFQYFDQLRQQHFPPERNYLSAHITLFHALPGNQDISIRQTLQASSSGVSRVPLTFPKPRFFGRGVAVEVDCLELVQFRNQLATVWSNWLNRQDQQRYQPHITIQNKTTPETARQLYEQFINEWKPFEGYGEGLLLWRYKGGPWELVDEFAFK